MPYRSLLLPLLLAGTAAGAQQKAAPDPSGFYLYEGKTVTKGGDTYGYFGNAKVLRIAGNRIIVSFFICKGAPTYNSGSFTDTLPYRNGRALYRGDGTSDSSCRLHFRFYSGGLSVELQSQNPGFACGFGHSVDAYGTFRKVGTRKPTHAQVMEPDEEIRPAWAPRQQP